MWLIASPSDGAHSLSVLDEDVGDKASHSRRYSSHGEVSYEFGAEPTPLEGVFHKERDFGVV
jgi:hypothetical protein